VVLAPPTLLFAIVGGDLVGSVDLNVFKYIASPDYRVQTHVRWRRKGWWAPIADLGGLLLVGLSVAMALAFFVGFYYSLYHLVRYRSLPRWVYGIF